MKISELHSLFLECKGVSTDTRKISKQDMFFALKGESFDGNTFTQQALNNGAKYIVALANHHDHFDLFNSTYHEWNSVNVGPKKILLASLKRLHVTQV